jgi:hypothetical protein
MGLRRLSPGGVGVGSSLGAGNAIDAWPSAMLVALKMTTFTSSAL